MKHAVPLLVPATAVLVTALLAPNIAAQRDNVDLAWLKRKVVVSYGAVSVGKHGLHELPVGGTWRMGQNLASTLFTELPLLSGTTVVAPGGYRVNITRNGDQDLRWNIDGAGQALGESGNIQFAGDMSELKKKNKKLQLTWVNATARKKEDSESKEKEKDKDKGKTKAKGKGKSKAVRECALQVDFGVIRVSCPVTVVGATTHKVKGFTALGFSYPADVLQERLKAGKGTPVLSLTPKKPKKDMPRGYNLVITRDQASLVPFMAAPTTSFGFGAVVPPSSDWTTQGKIEWEADQTEAAHLKVVTLKLQKKNVLVELVVGDQRATVNVALPDGKN
ncbi:MAG: hypothetical protein ACYTFN_05550 [Planctomycetota bacterium]|jgi:hypothetical protein